MGGVAVGGRELWHGAARGLAQGMGDWDLLGFVLLCLALVLLWLFFGFALLWFCLAFALAFARHSRERGLCFTSAQPNIQGLSCENV
ncbi:hypothetical protein IEQ11_09320 [Lysobacter capsici]|uniref:hypothetical protein n=1 Tax=Lysobacter capsici TaxID=435897 RepID=UPI00177B3872|nr:hypothetical protein [Lysobacter capsici]UOF16808.1 hypothetical protein IEQ11_09320 [Lysobacter capsici]